MPVVPGPPWPSRPVAGIRLLVSQVLQAAVIHFTNVVGHDLAMMQRRHCATAVRGLIHRQALAARIAQIKDRPLNSTEKAFCS